MGTYCFFYGSLLNSKTSASSWACPRPTLLTRECVCVFRCCRFLPAFCVCFSLVAVVLCRVLFALCWQEKRAAVMLHMQPCQSQPQSGFLYRAMPSTFALVGANLDADILNLFLRQLSRRLFFARDAHFAMPPMPAYYCHCVSCLCVCVCVCVCSDLCLFFFNLLQLLRLGWGITSGPCRRFSESDKLATPRRFSTLPDRLRERGEK